MFVFKYGWLCCFSVCFFVWVSFVAMKGMVMEVMLLMRMTFRAMLVKTVAWGKL